MITIASEIRLTRHTDTGVVGDVASLVSCSTVVTIGLVVPWTDHVWLDTSDGRHLVLYNSSETACVLKCEQPTYVELVQNTLVNFVAICNGYIRKESLDLFFQPIVGICNVASCGTSQL